MSRAHLIRGADDRVGRGRDGKHVLVVGLLLNWSKEIYCDKKSIAKTKGKIVLFV